MSYGRSVSKLACHQGISLDLTIAPLSQVLISSSKKTSSLWAISSAEYPAMKMSQTGSTNLLKSLEGRRRSASGLAWMHGNGQTKTSPSIYHSTTRGEFVWSSVVYLYEPILTRTGQEVTQLYTNELTKDPFAAIKGLQSGQWASKYNPEQGEVHS